MKKAFEEKFLLMVTADIRKIFKDEKSITENYFEIWMYLNEVIDSVIDNASESLLTELYILRCEYQYKYLKNKGLI